MDSTVRLFPQDCNDYCYGAIVTASYYYYYYYCYYYYHLVPFKQYRSPRVSFPHRPL